MLWETQEAGSLCDLLDLNAAVVHPLCQENPVAEGIRLGIQCGRLSLSWAVLVTISLR